jgi:raffinose/stachyose/melibiose transport system substrate-binding protein
MADTSISVRLLGIFAATALAFAACASPEQPPGPGGSPADGQPPSPGESPADGQPSPGDGEQVTLRIESWRSEDLTIWEDQIIPAFEQDHPNIRVQFTPTSPDQYDPALRSKLEGGTAGDLIVCRPFDLSLAHFEAGFLTSLKDLPGMENFSDVAKSGWSTDDGSDVFCVPMASVIHGFMINADIFAELSLEKPETEDAFFEVMDAIRADGRYEPLALGTVDTWTVAAMGFNNIGPNYWAGEEGRQALIGGDAKFTDPEFMSVWETLQSWTDYMPEGYRAVNYSDTQNLFTTGRAAIFPTGSWEISGFEEQADFALDVFRPPVREAEQQCYISDHIDIAMGMNAATPHAEEARTFLEWLTGPEFADIYTNALPGFFSLSDHAVDVENETARTFLSWRQECDGTIRVADQILSRGEPNAANEIGLATAAVLNGESMPQDAGARVQRAADAGLAE